MRPSRETRPDTSVVLSAQILTAADCCDCAAGESARPDAMTTSHRKCWSTDPHWNEMTAEFTRRVQVCSSPAYGGPRCRHISISTVRHGTDRLFRLFLQVHGPSLITGYLFLD